MLSLTRTAIPVRRLVGTVAMATVIPAVAYAQTSADNVPPVARVEPAPAPAPHQVPLPYRWRGVYFGGFIGDVLGSSDVSTTTVFSPSGYFTPSMVADIEKAGAVTLHPNEVIYGGEGGYDFQVARLVFGGSVDFSVMNISETDATSANYSGPPAGFSITQRVETDWLMTARGRVGWVTGRRLLLFGTVGIAWTNLKYDGVFTDNLAAAHESANLDDVRSGWVYGGGAEYRLARHVSIKGEYLWTNFRTTSTTSNGLTTNLGSFPTNVFTHEAGLKLNVVKGSFKVRF